MSDETINQNAAATFESLGLGPEVRRALEEMGFAAPFEVQVVCVGPILEGRDVMVQARTGSGKTAAFAIPFAERLVRPDEARVQALVIEPTRELAIQVSQECARVAQHRGLKVVTLYGGTSMGRQIEGLRGGAQIAVGTPGRLLDHMRRGAFKTDGVRMVVLDECDEMLSRGFLEDIEAILGRLPAERQTMLFSATIPEGIVRLSGRYLRDPQRFNLSADFAGVHEIHHVYYLVTGGARLGALERILEIEQPKAALIFCNTRDATAQVAAGLHARGWDAEPISSDLQQADRERVMGLMKDGKLRFLVATDIAGRGIDIAELSHVINYDFPEAAEPYLHRTGRTGRAGRAGVAISLVGPQEIGTFHTTRLEHGLRFEERHLPTEAELRARAEGERYAALRERLVEDPGEEWRALARRAWTGEDGQRIVAEALRRLFEAPRHVPAPPPARQERRDASPAEPRFRVRGHEREHGHDRATGPERGRGRDRDRGHRDRGRDRGRDHGPRRADEHEFWETWAAERGRGGGTRGPAAPEGECPPADDDERGFTRLHLNVGRREGVRASEIARLLKDAAGLRRRDIGRVSVRESHTQASVRAELADQVIAALAGRGIGAKR